MNGNDRRREYVGLLLLGMVCLLIAGGAVKAPGVRPDLVIPEPLPVAIEPTPIETSPIEPVRGTQPPPIILEPVSPTPDVNKPFDDVLPPLESLHVDLDIDADRDGNVADPLTEPQRERVEDSLEEKPGGKVQLSGQSALVLRRMPLTPRMPAVLRITRENAKVDIKLHDGRSIFADGGLISRDLAPLVCSSDLRLMIEGNSPGSALVKATLALPDHVRLEDAVSVTIEMSGKPVSMRLLGRDHKVYDTLEFDIAINRGLYAGYSEGLLLTRNFTPVDCFDAVDADGNGKSIQVWVMASTKPMISGWTVWNEFDAAVASNDAYNSASFVTPAYYARVAQGIGAENWTWRARLFVPAPGRWYFYTLVKTTNGTETVEFPSRDKRMVNGHWWHLHGVNGVAEGRWPRNTIGWLEVYNGFRNPYFPVSTGYPITTYSTTAPISPTTTGRKYFHRRPLAGESQEQPTYIFGHCRAWNRWDTDQPWKTVWHSAYADPYSGIFEPLATKFPSLPSNDRFTRLLSHWFTCWDTSVIHSGTNEEWRPASPGTSRTVQATLPIVQEFDSGAAQPLAYQYYDQGRAAMIDEIFDAAEKNGGHVMFTIWAHPDLRDSTSKWGVDRWQAPRAGEPDTFSGWYTASRPLVRTFLDNSMSDASVDWMHQQNLYRYIVGRWGNRRGLGLWEGLSEIEGPVSDTDTTPAADRVTRTNLSNWIQNRVKPEVQALNPFRQPFSSSHHTIEPGWGASITSGVDYISTHAYYHVWESWTTNNNPRSVEFNDDMHFLTRTVDRITGYQTSMASLNMPVFNGEIGTTQRWPNDTRNAKYRYKLGEPLQLAGNHTSGNETSRYEVREKSVASSHFGTWAAFMSGACATPLQWCDGKEFGEMAFRGTPTSNRFTNTNYEINFYNEIKPVYNLIAGAGGLPAVKPWDYSVITNLSTTTGYTTRAIKRQTGTGPLGVIWIYQSADTVSSTRQVDIRNITTSSCRIQWVDPWSGAALGTPVTPSNNQEVDFWTDAMEDVAPDGYGRRRHQQQDVVGIILEPSP